MKLKFFLYFFLSFHLYPFAQNFEEEFTPLKTSSKESVELVSAIQRSHERELARYSREVRVAATPGFLRQQKFLISVVKNGGVLVDNRLQSIVQEVIRQVTDANRLKRYPSRILILKYPFANAFSFGEGTLAVTVGLLNEIKTKDETCFYGKP